MLHRAIESLCWGFKVNAFGCSFCDVSINKSTKAESRMLDELFFMKFSTFIITEVYIV